MLRAFYRVNFVTSHTKNNSTKYFRSKMLSYSSQREEDDLKHLNAVSCKVKTTVVCGCVLIL